MDDLFDKIKDSVSKAKDGAEQVAKTIAKHTSNAINGTKLSISINEANNKLNDIYAKIGKTVYETHAGGDVGDFDFDEEHSQIEQLLQDIETLTRKKAELKHTVCCDECGTLNNDEADFCSKCGSELKKSDRCDNADEYYDADDIGDETITITPQHGE